MATIERFPDYFIIGDTWPFRITIKDATGVAVDVSTFTFYFTIKKNYTKTDTNAVFQKDITTLSDPIHGIVDFVVSSTESKLIPAGICKCDISYTYSGVVQTALFEIEVVEDITKRA
jgi:hypothetical protein